MQRKNKSKVIIGLLILALAMSILAGCSSQKASTTTQAPSKNATTVTGNASKDSDGDGIPDVVEKTYGTNPYAADTDGDGQNDKVDKTPLWSEKTIQETSTVKLPVSIKDVRVEDNVTADHLEIALTNTGNTILQNFDIYYSITDKVTNKKETYYQKLVQFTLQPGETKSLHFDNKTEAGHYYGNMNGLYGTSRNGLRFDIILHSSNYQPLTFKVDKAKGTAEVAD